MSNISDALRRELEDWLQGIHYSPKLARSIADALISGPIAKHTAALRAPSSAEAMREAAAKECDWIAAKYDHFNKARWSAEECAKAVRALSPDPGSAPVEGWRTIETAPKDGTLFLMWLPGDDDLGYLPTVHVGFRDRHGYVQSFGLCGQMEDDVEPTHWMPLPPPPPAEPSRDAQDGERG